MQITLGRDWLTADLGRMRRILSFAPHRPGFQYARHVLIRQVRDADLGPDFDAASWFSAQMTQAGHARDVGMMTSRALRHYRLAVRGPVTCLATVGLGNTERVGQRRAHPGPGYGTINIILLVEQGLTEAAMIEALTITAEARTLAVIEAGVLLPAGPATGTGTDCIALACDAGETAFAGLHTPLGEAIGATVHQAVLAGALDWLAVQGQPALP